MNELVRDLATLAVLVATASGVVYGSRRADRAAAVEKLTNAAATIVQNSREEADRAYLELDQLRSEVDAIRSREVEKDRLIAMLQVQLQEVRDELHQIRQTEGS